MDVIKYCVGTGHIIIKNYDLALTANEQFMVALAVPKTGGVSDGCPEGDTSQVNTLASTNVTDRTGLELWEYKMAA